jgi:hypothetical protein
MAIGFARSAAIPTKRSGHRKSTLGLVSKPLICFRRPMVPPMAERSFADVQYLGDLALGPALVLEVPGL